MSNPEITQKLMVTAMMGLALRSFGIKPLGIVVPTAPEWADAVEKLRSQMAKTAAENGITNDAAVVYSEKVDTIGWIV